VLLLSVIRSPFVAVLDAPSGSREVGLAVTPKGKAGRVTLPLIAPDATPTVLVTNEDIAGALDTEAQPPS
jgi:hypothetical protein